MAKHKLKIDTDVRIKVGYRTMDPVAVKVIEEEAVGTINDLNEFEDDLYYVLFDGYLTDEGTDFCLWLKADELEIV